VSDAPSYEWVALRGVGEGDVAKSAGVYLRHGCPVPSHLTEVFDRLTWTGLVTVTEGDPIWSVRQLSLTDAGHARYAALCEQRQRAQLEAPTPQFLGDGRPTAAVEAGTHDPLDHLTGQSGWPAQPRPGSALHRCVMG
jgi:hypothetical protein